MHFERYFTPCSHGPWCFGALFRFVPFLVNSSLRVSVFSASPTSGTSILTRGLQTVVIPIREVGAPLEVRDLPRDISAKNREGVPRWNPTVESESNTHPVENAHHLSLNAHTQKVESHPSVRFSLQLRLFAPTSGSPKGRGRPPHFTPSVPTRPETYRAREYTRAYTPRTLPTPPLSPKDAGALGGWRGHPKLISEEETRPEKGYPEARLSHDRHNATWPRRPPKSRRRRFPRRPMYPR